MKEYPLVSFIIPVKDEERTLAACLDSILGLDYPVDKVEVVLAVFDLNDATGRIAEMYAHRYMNIHTVNNISGNTSVGRNICLAMAHGDLVMDYSGHVTAEPSLLKVLVSRLLSASEEVVGVGCSNVSPEGENSLVGETAGVVFNSFFGGGGMFCQNRVYDTEREVEHVSFCLYRKKAVLDVGGFDPLFWCGQDAELDVRLVKKGYVLWYSPDTRVYHVKRQLLRGVFTQMYRYGCARAKIIRKHHDSFKPFYLLGVFFVLGVFMFSGLIVSGLLPVLSVVPLVVGYFVVSWFSSLQKTDNGGVLFVSPLVYFVVHMGYGLGFLQGLVCKRPLRDRVWGALCV